MPSSPSSSPASSPRARRHPHRFTEQHRITEHQHRPLTPPGRLSISLRSLAACAPRLGSPTRSPSSPSTVLSSIRSTVSASFYTCEGPRWKRERPTGANPTSRAKGAIARTASPRETISPVTLSLASAVKSKPCFRRTTMRNILRFSFLASALLFTLAAAAQTSPQATSPAAPPPVSVPPALLKARTVFISNAGADSGLFPSPFSGDPDRAYQEFYAAIQSWQRYRLVADPAQADLVLELRLTAPNGPQVQTSRPAPPIRCPCSVSSSMTAARITFSGHSPNPSTRPPSRRITIKTST